MDMASTFASALTSEDMNTKDSSSSSYITTTTPTPSPMSSSSLTSADLNQAVSRVQTFDSPVVKLSQRISAEITRMERNMLNQDILTSKFLQIKKELGPLFQFNPDCRLIRDGYLTKYSGSKTDTYYFILTTDLLLYAKRSSTIQIFGVFTRSKLTPKLSIPLTSMLVKNVISVPNGFAIHSKIKSFYVIASNAMEAGEWFNDINDQVM